MYAVETTRTPPTLALTVGDLRLDADRTAADDVRRVLDTPITTEQYALIREHARGLTVGRNLTEVVAHFGTEAGHTPPGFRRELRFDGDALVVDLARDISYDADGRRRPTGVLFSADSANPYEIAPIAPLVANLTCNPGIIYDLFLNNPQANIDRKFTDRDQVMTEIGRVLGPGADISVELNNPFEPDIEKILDECRRFREILSPWRVVIKVPHTGPVNNENVGQLLDGDARLDVRYSAGTTADRLRGHNLALRLAEEGFRVNFTLMLEPHQVQLALQARPYFVNAFVRHRKLQTDTIAGLLRRRESTGDEAHLTELRDYLVKTDYLSSAETGIDLREAETLARSVLATRGIRDLEELGDGLDSARHALRALRAANLPDTRLIICSMEGDLMYPDVDRLVAEPEFADMTDRIVITAEPQYLARFASANQVVSYQRRFMKAAAGQS